MPLVTRYLNGVNDPDLTPLSECKSLQRVVLPLKARNIQALRNLPELQKISLGWVSDDKLPDEAAFWKDYDAQQAAGKK